MGLPKPEPFLPGRSELVIALIREDEQLCISCGVRMLLASYLEREPLPFGLAPHPESSLG